MFFSFLLSLFFIGSTQTVHAQVQAATTPVVIAAPTTTASLIHAAAMRYGVNEDRLYRTLRCESNLNSSAVGDRGTSFGIAQIHLVAHPEITHAQAMSSSWSIDWAARQFSTGHAGMWSCFRILFG